LILLATLESFAQHISLFINLFFTQICDRRRIRNTIDHTTACTIVTFLIHSKSDYCNSLLLNLPAIQTNRIQLVLNAAAGTVTKTPKFHHITPILISLHWLKIHEQIKYKVLSGTYKSLKNLSKLVNLLTSALFFHSLHILILGLLLLSLSVALLSYLVVLKLQTDLYIILLLFCGTVLTNNNNYQRDDKLPPICTSSEP